MDPNLNPVNLPIISRQKLRELSHMAAPGEKMEPSVEGILVKIAEDFISKVAQSSSDLARHRKSKVLEVDDVQLHLERVWDLGITGFGSGEVKRSARPAGPTDGHMQKTAMVQKEMYRQF